MHSPTLPRRTFEAEELCSKEAYTGMPVYLSPPFLSLFFPFCGVLFGALVAEAGEVRSGGGHALQIVFI